MSLKITFKKSVQKDLRKLDEQTKELILDKVESELVAKANACPVLKHEFAGLRKYRIGNYRLIFALMDDEILVLRVGHRKNIYK